MEWDWQEAVVRYPGRLAKFASYILDRAGIYWPGLFQGEFPEGHFDWVISCGSTACYPGAWAAREFRCRRVVVMLPRGYRYCADLILAQEHDNPPRRDNIVALPVNLSAVAPEKIFTVEGEGPVAALVVGGPTRELEMPVDLFRQQVESLFEALPDHRFVVATSRRTPAEVDQVLAAFPFEQAWIFSRSRANPIPDMLERCDYVFVTSDSTSILSEAVTSGESKVEVLLLKGQGPGGKYQRFIERLVQKGCLHIFDNTVGDKNVKIDLSGLVVPVIKRLGPSTFGMKL